MNLARLRLSEPRGLAVFIALVGSAAWLASTLSGTPLVGYDDANVFFVYARNVLDGHGLVFNAGGERVEGFTSPLWLLICTAARATTPRFEILLFAINVVFVSAALWVLHRFVADRLRSSILGFALVAAIALTPGFVVWNVVSLMDSGLWSAVFVIATVAVLRSARILPLLLIALVLTRPESLIFGPALIAVAWGVSKDLPLRTIAAFVVTTAALLIWRLAYFGYPLPNTYYATAGEPIFQRLAAGFDYFSDFGLANPLVPVALVAGVITTARSPSRAQAGLLALMVISCAVPIIEGGDRFGFWRMYQPVVPLALIQVAFTAAALATTKPTQARMVCVVAILLALVPWRHWAVLDDLDYASASTTKGIWYTPKVEISIADDMRSIGAAFNRAFPDVKPSVGVIVAGGFALTYTGPTIDLLGHNHVAMAHSPGPRIGPRGEMAFDPDVFTSLQPDVALLSRWSPDRDWFAFPMLSGEYDQPPHLQPDYFQRRAASMRIFDYGVMKGLLLRSEAGKQYAWASVRRQGATGWIHAIFNRAFLKRLEGRGYEVVFATPSK
jgi:arabinofuranosyltransferase